MCNLPYHSSERKTLHVRCFAVRDDAGAYLGTLEMTQNITGIKKIERARRLSIGSRRVRSSVKAR